MPLRCSSCNKFATPMPVDEPDFDVDLSLVLNEDRTSAFLTLTGSVTLDVESSCCGDTIGSVSVDIDEVSEDVGLPDILTKSGFLNDYTQGMDLDVDYEISDNSHEESEVKEGRKTVTYNRATGNVQVYINDGDGKGGSVVVWEGQIEVSAPRGDFEQV